MWITKPDFEQAQFYAHIRLESELPAHFTYHSLYHTEREVLPAIEQLSAMEGVNTHDRYLLRTAAWFHDLGFVELSENHEVASEVIAREVLPPLGFNRDELAVISGLIMATKSPKTPRTALEHIMVDADLCGVGSTNFLKRNQDLRLELASLGKVYSDVEWYCNQIKFMKSHRYFTQAAAQINSAQKERNMILLNHLLEQAEH